MNTLQSFKAPSQFRKSKQQQDYWVKEARFIEEKSNQILNHRVFKQKREDFSLDKNNTKIYDKLTTLGYDSSKINPQQDLWTYNNSIFRNDQLQTQKVHKLMNKFDKKQKCSSQKNIHFKYQMNKQQWKESKGPFCANIKTLHHFQPQFKQQEIDIPMRFQPPVKERKINNSQERTDLIQIAKYMYMINQKSPMTMQVMNSTTLGRPCKDFINATRYNDFDFYKSMNDRDKIQKLTEESKYKLAANTQTGYCSKYDTYQSGHFFQKQPEQKQFALIVNNTNNNAPKISSKSLKTGKKIFRVIKKANEKTLAAAYKTSMKIWDEELEQREEDQQDRRENE